MKKLLITLSLISISFCSQAQVTLQHTFPARYNKMEVVYLKHSGFKYIVYENDSLLFYNLNYSLFKAFPIPGSPPMGYSLFYVSEGLFDNDTNHIDYMIENGTTPPLSITVYKEDITTVFQLTNATVGIGAFPGMGSPVDLPVFTSDSGTFMLATEYVANTSTPKNELVYKLGGSFPCMPTCYGSGIITTENPVGGQGNGYSELYPNPATSYTDVYYTLPDGANTGELVLYDVTGKEIKSFTVDRRFTHLHITTTDVAAGTYFYQLSANGNYVSGKKLVVVK